ncbi:MAG: 8-oxoguanine DNA glycosylase [Lachnospiraceae bacterium]|nr:8-oxoguanine DNA glycosylase [Lachnospiraceae bacterium]
MVAITKDYFSLRQICESGQCFRLERLTEADCGKDEKEKYALTAFGRYLEIEQEENKITFFCTQEEFEKIWKDYFDLEEDYCRIRELIDKNDKYLIEAAAYGSGIRILRQDLWEMIISFIISQQNNIKRIKKCIDLLCRRYGEEKQAQSGKRYYDFPRPEVLAAASLEELYACNLGYRSRYIHNTAASILRGEVNLDALKGMHYERAKEELVKLCGVGVKVAECVCLFGLHKTEAFPIDTHINKVLKQQYPGGFPYERYKGYEGTLQQYIFYYDLMTK